MPIEDDGRGDFIVTDGDGPKRYRKIGGKLEIVADYPSRRRGTDDEQQIDELLLGVTKRDLNGPLSGIGKQIQAQGQNDGRPRREHDYERSGGDPRTVVDEFSERTGEDTDILVQPSRRPRGEFGDNHPVVDSHAYSADDLDQDDLWSKENINPLVEENNHSPTRRVQSALDELEDLFNDEGESFSKRRF